jgi:hypothetical protein
MSAGAFDQIILEALATGPRTMDQLTGEQDISSPLLLGTLRDLERRGLVRFSRGVYERTRSVMSIEDPAPNIDIAVEVPAPLEPVTSAQSANHAPTPPAPRPPPKEPAAMSKTKTCTACKVDKPLTDFYTNQYNCKPCLLAKQKAARLARLAGTATARPKRHARAKTDGPVPLAAVNGSGANYRAVIAELRAKRDQIDAAIAGLEALG